jgi:hypothetical protein
MAANSHGSALSAKQLVNFRNHKAPQGEINTGNADRGQ